MAKECFCGCGRRVPFGRKRITNTLGAQLTKDIELFEGALARTPDPAHDAELRELVATGPRLRDGLRDIIHGTLDSDDYPRDDGEAWLGRANEQRGRMAMEVAKADFAGWNAHDQSRLIRTGVAATAMIVAVADTGATVNDDPRVELTLRVDPPDGGAPIELKRKLLVSRVNLPRRGERVQVYYDPDDLEKFTFEVADATDGELPAPTPAAAAADPVDQLARLAELHRAGALTDDEFAAAKQRLLGSL
jgi:hypothetical protein